MSSTRHETRATPANWAKPVDRLHVDRRAPQERRNLVEGKRLVGPIQGFGKMWQKTYRVRLDGARSRRPR